MSYKYKNKTNYEQVIPGVGVVEAGGEVTSSTPIENPNFEFVSKSQSQSVVGTEAPQPNAVVEAERVSENKEETK